MTLSIRIKLMAHVTFAHRKFHYHNFYSYRTKQTDQDKFYHAAAQNLLENKTS